MMKNKKKDLVLILIVFILIIITSYAVDNSYNPFLYFIFWKEEICQKKIKIK